MPANHTARNQWNAQVLGSTMVKVWCLYIAWFSKALLGDVVETSSPETYSRGVCWKWALTVQSWRQSYSWFLWTSASGDRIKVDLSNLARKTLCITATNIPSERLFSSARNLVSNKRSCLLPENVANLMKICSSPVSCVTFHVLCTNCLYNLSMWVLYINNNQCILAALMCAVHLRALHNCVHTHTHTHIHTHTPCTYMYTLHVYPHFQGAASVVVNCN